MPVVEILIGPPATGKSTYRMDRVARDGWKYTNLDELRLTYPEYTERQIHEVQTAQLLEYMRNGDNIVIDNLNLNERTVARYIGIANQHGYAHKLVRFGASVHWSEAVRRDSLRHARVGQSVIIQSYMNAGLYTDETKAAYVWDIDGTLADIQHRKHFVSGSKDWKGFFSAMSGDTIRTGVYSAYVLMRVGMEANNTRFPDGIPSVQILVSGRPSEYRKETEAWLKANHVTGYFALFMRPFNDKRPDTEIKAEIYHKYIQPHFTVMGVFDDRPSVIRMWRSKGLTVFDCGNGEEF